MAWACCNSVLSGSYFQERKLQSGVRQGANQATLLRVHDPPPLIPTEQRTIVSSNLLKADAAKENNSL